MILGQNSVCFKQGRQASASQGQRGPRAKVLYCCFWFLVLWFSVLVFVFLFFVFVFGFCFLFGEGSDRVNKLSCKGFTGPTGSTGATGVTGKDNKTTK